jgi:serine/threonine-protein kinase
LPIETDRPSSPVSSSSADHGRFIPGTVLVKRYRIIGLLGRGGMGEVYRADDLKLGQPVALKFLPRGLEKDEGRLQRFLNEVRMALKVSHPNVCRVHDIGEFEGQHFISMEYVDGEDLASLLRRIGRLPKSKAIQAARQVCAGLAAAHDQGVLHRDLKPANVMIDGRGQVKIADFGLAGLDDSIEGAEARAGTPAYMAPEQWAGQEVTVKSDLYSLGMLLYELFTGEQPYKGATPAEIVQAHEESTPTTPSSLVEGFDPAVERVILKCLEKDAAQRPPSALAVAAALPGGDPLAAALAAGETPSPELVAQAGGAESVSPKIVIGLFLAALVFTALWVVLAPQTQGVGYIDLQKSPEVLVARAREILLDFGYEEVPGDSLFNFEPNYVYLGHIEETDVSPDRWDRLRDSQPPALRFFYRQSPHPIVKWGAGSIGAWMEDPAMTIAGEAMVELDPKGRLRSFLTLPPEGPFRARRRGTDLGAAGVCRQPYCLGRVLSGCAGYRDSDRGGRVSGPACGDASAGTVESNSGGGDGRAGRTFSSRCDRSVCDVQPDDPGRDLRGLEECTARQGRSQDRFPFCAVSGRRTPAVDGWGAPCRGPG